MTFFSNCTVEFYPPTEPRRAQSFFLNALICLEFSEVACAPLRARSKLAERKVIYALFRMALCVLLGALATFVDSSKTSVKVNLRAHRGSVGGKKTTSSFRFCILYNRNLSNRTVRKKALSYNWLSISIRHTKE